ncbi:FG-nucleoporin nsp1, partial [Serendipita sp. 398]
TTTPAKPGGFGGFSFGVTKPAEPATPAATNTEAPAKGPFGGAPSFGNTAGGLFGTAPAAGGAPTSSLFGSAQTTSAAAAAKQPTTTTAPATTTNLFGTRPGGLFGTTPATTNPPTTGNASSTPSLFGAPPVSTTAATTTSAPAIPSLFGAAPTTTTGTNQPATTTPSLFGNPPAKTGGLFGGIPTLSTTGAASVTAGTTAPADAAKTGLGALGQTSTAAKGPAPAPSLTGFTWGKLDDKKSDTTATSSTAAAPATAAAATTSDKPATPALATTSLFGATPATATATAAAGAAAAPTAGTTATTKPAETTTAAPGTSSALTIPPSLAPGPATSAAPLASVAPSVLKGKTLEEIVSRWASELDSHARDFSGLANEIAHWDRELSENGQQIAHLQQKLIDAESTQVAIDANLDHVEQQQRELANALDSYEKQAREILETGSTGSVRVFDMGPADAERDKSYALAAELNTQLDNLSKSLSQMIESVNSLTAPTQSSTSNVTTGADSDAQGSEDPLMQIATVLNAHLKSLQWIDTTVQEVETKIVEAETKVKGLSGGGGSGGGRTHQSVRSIGGPSMTSNITREGSGGSSMSSLAGFGNMSLRASEGPRARGFGLGSSSRY